MTVKTKDAETAVANLRTAIYNIKGKTVQILVKAVTEATAATSGLSGINSTMAHGGIVGAAGGGPRSNRTLVGEHGPEIVRLPYGSQVHSNPDSMRMLAEEGRGTNRVVLEINAAGNDVSRMLVEILKNAIRVQGGDVQVVLGR